MLSSWNGFLARNGSQGSRWTRVPEKHAQWIEFYELTIMDFLQSLWLSYLYDIHIPIKMIQPQLWLRIQVTTCLLNRADRAVTAQVKMVHFDLHRLKGLWCRFGPGQTTSLSHLSILLSFIQHSKRFNTSEADQKQYAFVSLVVSRPTSPPSLGVESQFWKDKLIDQSDVKHQWKNVGEIDINLS